MAYREWKGKFYPSDLPPEKALGYYAKTFSMLELNNTFYRTPSTASLKEIASGLPANFPIAVKTPQQITHMKRLKNCAAPARAYFKGIAVFGKRAVALVQLPPNFKQDLPRLENFFKLVPRGVPVAMEFRHASWFIPEVYAFLKKKNAAFVYNDTDVDAMPMESTADWGFLRLRKLRYSDSEMRNILKAIKAKKWKKTFVIFKHEEKVTAPKLAGRFRAIARA